MFHGIYIKTRPKGYWRLIKITLSPEMAACDVASILEQAKKEDNDKIQACYQIYNSSFHIPEWLKKVKECKLMYN